MRHKGFWNCRKAKKGICTSTWNTVLSVQLLITMHIPTKWLLTEFQLFQEMWQQLSKSLVTHTALHYIGILVSASHDLHPLFVNVLKSFCFLKIKEYRRFKGNNDLAIKKFYINLRCYFLPKGKELVERLLFGVALKRVKWISPLGSRLPCAFTNLPSSLLDIQILFSTFSKILNELGIARIMLRVEIPAEFNYFISFKILLLFNLCKLSIDVVTHLWQLLCDISSNKHSLEVNPQVLYCQPVLNNIGCVWKFLYPALDVLLERRIIPDEVISLHVNTITNLNIHLAVLMPVLILVLTEYNTFFGYPQTATKNDTKLRWTC